MSKPRLGDIPRHQRAPGAASTKKQARHLRWLRRSGCAPAVTLNFSAAGTMNVASTSPVPGRHSSRSNCATTSLGRRLIPTPSARTPLPERLAMWSVTPPVSSLENRDSSCHPEVRWRRLWGSEAPPLRFVWCQAHPRRRTCWLFVEREPCVWWTKLVVSC